MKIYFYHSKYLIIINVKMNVIYPNPELLVKAIERQDLIDVENLLLKRVDLHYQNDLALQTSIIYRGNDSESIFRLLLKYGADIHTDNLCKLATGICGNLFHLELLLKYGAKFQLCEKLWLNKNMYGNILQFRKIIEKNNLEFQHLNNDISSSLIKTKDFVVNHEELDLLSENEILNIREVHKQFDLLEFFLLELLDNWNNPVIESIISRAKFDSFGIQALIILAIETNNKNVLYSDLIHTQKHLDIPMIEYLLLYYNNLPYLQHMLKSVQITPEIIEIFKKGIKRGNNNIMKSIIFEYIIKKPNPIQYYETLLEESILSYNIEIFNVIFNYVKHKLSIRFLKDLTLKNKIPLVKTTLVDYISLYEINNKPENLSDEEQSMFASIFSITSLADPTKGGSDPF